MSDNNKISQYFTDDPPCFFDQLADGKKSKFPKLFILKPKFY